MSEKGLVAVLLEFVDERVKLYQVREVKVVEGKVGMVSLRVR